jgi:transposase
VLEDAGNEVCGLARLALDQAWDQCLDLEKRLLWCDERIAAHVKDSPQARKAKQLIGIGPITASAVVATVVDFKQFKNGAQFGVWLGLTPGMSASNRAVRSLLSSILNVKGRLQHERDQKRLLMKEQFFGWQADVSSKMQ